MKEFRGSQIRWDEENQVVRANGVGLADEDLANWMVAETDILLEKYGNNLNWLFDLSNLSQTTSGGRKIISKHMNHPCVGKCAILGGSVFMRTVAKFINTASNRQDVQFFSDEEKALKWFRES